MRFLHSAVAFIAKKRKRIIAVTLGSGQMETSFSSAAITIGKRLMFEIKLPPGWPKS